jgi:hypothetical protein
MLCFCDYRAVFSANLDSNEVLDSIPPVEIAATTGGVRLLDEP